MLLFLIHVKYVQKKKTNKQKLKSNNKRDILRDYHIRNSFFFVLLNKIRDVYYESSIYESFLLSTFISFFQLVCRKPFLTRHKCTRNDKMRMIHSGKGVLCGNDPLLFKMITSNYLLRIFYVINNKKI